MKPRKVIITIETETDVTIKELRDWRGEYVGMRETGWPPGRSVFVDQIQVNVVKPTEHVAP